MSTKKKMIIISMLMIRRAARRFASRWQASS